jgi:50S ribosomal subunit-associated GTPase HflX
VTSQVQAQTDAIPMVLIANKSDLTDRYAVTHDEAEATAASMGVQLFWASAKTGENVQAALEHLGRLAAQKALAAKPLKSPEPVSGGLVNLKESEPAVSTKSCAC